MIRNEKGVTLLELMITICVAAVVILSLLGFSATLQVANRSAYERSVALQDANQVIELMRNVAATGTFPSNVTASYPNGGTVGGFSTLSGESVTVSYANSTANPLDVTVTVSYNSNGDRAATESLRTYITQRA